MVGMNGLKVETLRTAITNSIAEQYKSYDVADVCSGLLGLPGSRNEYDDPHSSKRSYVRTRLKGKTLAELVEMARKLTEEYNDSDLDALLANVDSVGVEGEVKNIIFAANGPKPRIVLRGAINNVIEIEENAQYCLIYDRQSVKAG